ncbi:MAG: DEAD/DEAH box helicase, partial [Candidatus Paceibacterota bacterium]
MATNPEAIVQLIREATAPGFRDDLLAKGQARSMIWRDGALPPNTPLFSTFLSYDLLAYAYTLLMQGLRLLDQGEESEIAQSAFENAASAIEAVVTRGQVNNERDFHRLTAAACYHLAHYSARAYSLLHDSLTTANLSNPERALALLMLRDIDGLDALIAKNRLSGHASDDALIGMLAETDGLAAEDEEDVGERLFDVVDVALADHF